MLLSVFSFCIALGIFRFSWADIPAPQFFETKVGEKVTLSGLIIDEPSISENSQKIIVRTVLLGTSSRTVLNKEVNILLTTDFSQDFQYGDEVEFSGKLEKPENFLTDQGKDFDYINYLRKDNIFYLMKYPHLEIISRDGGNLVKRFLFSFKDKFLEKINYVIRDPESLFMGGLILGEKSSFNESLRQSFIDTGTIHVVALSGYNVTIVAEYFMLLFAFLSLNFSIGMGILAIILFVIMAGGASTAIRAGIMAILVLIARATGRTYDVARALFVAAIFMMIINPFVLVFDVSFQLSFIATIAVIFFTPKIEKYFQWVPKKFNLRDVVSMTLAAYIFVLPFILYKMGNLSLVALPANILILPFIPLTMLLGFLTGITGFLSYFLSLPFGYLSYLLLHYELSVISFFASLPFASFNISNFPLSLTILIYLYFIYILFGRNIKNFFKIEN
jgi:competence protein ComEC